ncbi:MAG TPA: deoxyribonuclease IV [Desulfobacteraceae bacterium]|nr:deoxyribonuclease IV [Desulfobacteraceae bacterium]
MPLLGAHESVAGGLHLAFDRIAKVGGEALQIFTRNQRQWHALPLTEEEIALFRRKWEKAGWMPVASHASYLINLGSSREKQAEDSITAFAGELQRCDSLGIPWAVIHPGSHGGAGIEAGLEKVARHLDRVFELAGRSKVTVLLETTAGQGTGLGSRFEELAWIIGRSRFAERLGVCFDTCHVFAAGYDIRSKDAYGQTMAEFDRTVGIARLQFFHLNDAKKDLGSRVDRHEHIGMGMIGLEGFRPLLSDRRFAAHPMTLETPKGEDLAEDRENLRRLRSLLQE